MLNSLTADGSFEIKILDPKDASQFKRDMQDAFQHGAEAHYGKLEGDTLPESHIDESLDKPTSIAYEATLDREHVGGAIVSFPEDGKGELEFLYVKVGTQGKGVGKRIWFGIEAMHPEVREWETCTPYFDKRNIHFYINVCGFAAVEFFNEKHPNTYFESRSTEDVMDPSGLDDGMLRFVKHIR